MTSCHALYAEQGHEPWLILLPLERGSRSRAVAVPTSGPADSVRVQVTVRQPDGPLPADLPREDDANEGSLPITIDGEQQKLTVSLVEATGHVAFALSAGGRGVVGVDQGDSDVQGLFGLDDVTVVAIVAIIAIAVMVSASEGADVLVKGGGVEVSVEGGGDGPRPGGGS